MVLTGWAGSAVYVVLAILCASAAWATYKLKRAAWWLVLIVVVVFGLSNFVTYLLVDFIDLYRRMGLDETQIDAINRLHWTDGKWMAWLSLAYGVAMTGYILYTGRFFKGRALN